jgi:hypothetical protein
MEKRTVIVVDLFTNRQFIETICLLYHQKEDYISVPYEPKKIDYSKQQK